MSGRVTSELLLVGSLPVGSTEEAFRQGAELFGDLVFALATGKSGIVLPANDAIDLYAAAGATMARAISRGIHAASPAAGDLFPVWSSRSR